MIHSTSFLSLIENINHSAFAKYLKDTGWRQFKSKRTNVKIFQREEAGKFFQVTLPVERELSDFNTAMYKAVEIVAEVEKKSVEQVFLYLLNPNTDILKVRIEKNNVEAGSILFRDALPIYVNAKNLLEATTLDILQPKRYHQGKANKATLDFLSHCRFGQTEIGSYIISIICPFGELSEDDVYKQLSIFSDEERCMNSLTRKVTAKVMTNLDRIKSCIDDGEIEKLVSFDESDMISANFYEALAGMNMEEPGVALGFEAEWAPVLRRPENVNSRLVLTHDYFQPLQEVIGKLKEETEKFQQIIGRIKKMESSPDAQERTKGKITVAYLDDKNRARTVSAILSKNEYHQAIAAHERGLYVELVGTLPGNHGNQIECESFKVLE